MSGTPLQSDRSCDDFFRLRPARAAKVSEVSEATAAAPVPPEERVNFHIGNPVQDDRLVQAFFRIALGLEPIAPLSPSPIDQVIDETGMPMGNTRVMLVDGNNRARTTNTDDAGEFRFDNVVPGEQLRISAGTESRRSGGLRGTLRL